ncbi:MAG: Ig-like domain-containing protein [Colwellia sp.]|nr:Ig-like domain-containing protein [Colwellia sp.]
MKKLYLTLLLTWLTLLSGCMGSSGENTVTDDTTEVSSIVLSMVNASGTTVQSFDKSDEITLTATVYDQFSNPIGSKRVDFTTDLGSLSASSKLTDDNGKAVVIISNELQTIGAATVNATSSGVSNSQDFEFVYNSDIKRLPRISTTLLLNGQPVSQFKADQQIQVVSTLVDNNNQAINNEIITFSADIGTLNTVSALTKINGVASVTLFGADIIGAGVITATLKSAENVSNRINYEIVSASSIIDDEVHLGYFDDNNSFIEGTIKLSADNNTVSAGGTLGLTVDLVNNENKRINTPTPVTFTSNCVLNGHAVIDETVFSINGKAQATFEDVDCAGVNGTDDVLIASVIVNGITNIATETIVITGEQLGSIEFISAEPDSIVIKGTGGQGKQETSTLTFKVKSELGNVLAQQQVTFSLDTSIGGIILSRNTGLTNSQGLITTQVTAGTVPTAVRVTAKSAMVINNETVNVQTQSDLLSINTGLAEQRSFTIAASVLNPEAFNGETSTITAWLADNFNNPVPDGTTINFTTEGGNIDASCNTLDGKCSVTWEVSEPRLLDHRSTILATAKGHESFFDTNGNNIFDENDGKAIIDNTVSSGFSRHNAESSGFIDMSEAWRDDNANNVKDANETIFFDDNLDGKFTAADGKFNGPQCQGNLCSIDVPSITLRKSLELVMSGSSAEYILTPTNGGTSYENTFLNSSRIIGNIGNGISLSLTFSFADSALQTLPLGTNITVSLSNGELAGQTSTTVANNNSSGYGSIDFIVVNPVGGDPEVATLTITVTTPNGIITSLVKTINLL